MRKTVSFLMIAVMILVTLGVIMLASTSGLKGMESAAHDPFLYIKKQLVWIVLSTLAAAVAMRIPYKVWRSLAIPIALISILLLVLVLIPGVGRRVGGSNRWLRFGPLGFQPSELAKLSVILLMAWYMSVIQRRPEEIVRGLIVPCIGLGTILAMILVEPDFGTTALIAAVGGLMMFIGGTRVGILAILGTIAATAFGILISMSPERLSRVIAFTDPIKYKQTDGYQLINALYAFVLGGETGVGLGNSIQKRFYLPEAHTDFIFAIIGEELGFPGTILVVLLFVVILICGWKIALNAGDSFGRLLALGITMMITIQASINMMVVTGMLPTKGLALPFISFGGSSFLISGLMIGILINIGMNPDEDEDL